MNISFTDIFAPEFIEPSTINGGIYLRPSIFISIYLLGIIVFVVYLIANKNKTTLVLAINRSLVVSLCCVGLIFALLNEVVWYRWLSHDFARFSGKSAEEKQLVVNGDLYDFFAECKKHIGNNNYILYPASPENNSVKDLTYRLQYYLLPSRKSSTAGYIIVLGDDSVRYDKGLAVLSGLNMQKTHAELLCKYNDNTYLLRVKK